MFTVSLLCVYCEFTVSLLWVDCEVPAVRGVWRALGSISEPGWPHRAGEAADERILWPERSISGTGGLEGQCEIVCDEMCVCAIAASNRNTAVRRAPHSTI